MKKVVLSLAVAFVGAGAIGANITEEIRCRDPFVVRADGAGNR